VRKHSDKSCLRKAEAYDQKADDFRIRAGLQLQQAHGVVPHGEWGLWIKNNVEYPPPGYTGYDNHATPAAHRMVNRCLKMVGGVRRRIKE
jgi:hypothetical protein